MIWLLPPWATAVAAAVAAALGAGELAAMAARLSARVPAALAGLAAASIVGAVVVSTGDGSGDALVVVLLAVLVSACSVVLAGAAPAPIVAARAAAAVASPLYVGLPLGAIGVIQIEAGAAATTWLLLVIAVSDSAQYYTGRAFGRRKLAPLVSPSKTVEGAVGGVVVATLVGAATAQYAVEGIGPVSAAALVLVMVLAGIVGDLFESLIKRSVGVKDSSALLPGHGGILDRIDSHLFAAPVFFVFLRYFS